MTSETYMARGRPPGRLYTEKVEVWLSSSQLEQLDALCEMNLGVRRAEVLRRALTAFLKSHSDTPTERARFEAALREIRRKRTPGQQLRAISIRPGATKTESERER
jgi:hypothetical protein